MSNFLIQDKFLEFDFDSFQEQKTHLLNKINYLQSTNEYSNELIEEIRPTSQPIGIVEYPKKYTQHELKLNIGDTIYLFSDGFADQFGGAKNKKFKLLYPYKKDSINFRMWKKYYSGASGLMGLKIKSKNINSVRKFVNSLKLFGYGYSWGGFESLALHQEFRETGKRKYMNLAKDEHLVRLHIGLEDPNDLIADIKQALRHLK